MPITKCKNCSKRFKKNENTGDYCRFCRSDNKEGNFQAKAAERMSILVDLRESKLIQSMDYFPPCKSFIDWGKKVPHKDQRSGAFHLKLSGNGNIELYYMTVSRDSDFPNYYKYNLWTSNRILEMEGVNFESEKAAIRKLENNLLKIIQKKIQRDNEFLQRKIKANQNIMDNLIKISRSNGKNER